VRGRGVRCEAHHLPTWKRLHNVSGQRLLGGSCQGLHLGSWRR
jgi:hypothetical protein